MIKLGASPQLEWWNSGILESWVLGEWLANVNNHRKHYISNKL
jgi:hypothetical protein